MIVSATANGASRKRTAGEAGWHASRYNLMAPIPGSESVAIANLYAGTCSKLSPLEGFLPAIPGTAWARRAHMICSYWTFILAFAHAGLHFRAPKRLAHGQLCVVRASCAALACYGVYSFIQLGIAPYLAGQVLFAAADFEAPLALLFIRYASIAALVAVLFHYLRTLLRSSTAREKRV